MNSIIQGDGIEMLASLEPRSVQLLWTDPPFGTANEQRIKSTGLSYQDVGVEGALALLRDIGDQAQRVLTEDGVLAVCLDYRAVHSAWEELAQRLVPHGEIVWTFGLGRTATNWWTNKHNTVVLFGLSQDRPRFHFDNVPVVPRRAASPGYPDVKKIASVWDYTLSSSSKERVGYPNQKPESLIEPFVIAHTDPGDLVVDPCAGSGTVAAVAERLGRRYCVADINPQAVQVMRTRLAQPSLLTAFDGDLS